MTLCCEGKSRTMDLCLDGKSRTMDVCLDGTPHPCISAFEAKQFNMQISYSPLVTRRPLTSFTQRQGFCPSPRIHSAQPRIAMTTAPRTQMSTVGFFDWSTDDPGDVAVTDIYRKIATTQKSKFNKSNRHWCADGIHLNPGRMFVRDKADLTKGEREIIAGIYKNRSDVHVRNGAATNVRSHKDAWLIGKQISKSPVDLDKYSVKITDRLLNKSDSKEDLTHPTCYLCANCKECYHNKADFRNRRQKKLPENAGRTAPPSSPSNSPPSTRKELKPIKDRTKEGGVFVEAEKTFYDAEEGAKKKKVFVDVFLPKFPTQMLHEEKTCSEMSVDRESKKTKSRREKSTSKRSLKENSEDIAENGSPRQSTEDSGKQKLFSSRSSSRMANSVED